jgi:signal peptidase complex subunit 2
VLTLNVNDYKGGMREASVTKSVANFVDVDGVICTDIVASEMNRLYNSLHSFDKKKEK